MLERPRIIDVERKPRKCPKCGERLVVRHVTKRLNEYKILKT